MLVLAGEKLSFSTYCCAISGYQMLVGVQASVRSIESAFCWNSESLLTSIDCKVSHVDMYILDRLHASSVMYSLQ